MRELANVDLMFLGNRQRSGAARPGPKQEKERICLRFFAALVLRDLISEVQGMLNVVFRVMGWILRCTHHGMTHP